MIFHLKYQNSIPYFFSMFLRFLLLIFFCFSDLLQACLFLLMPYPFIHFPMLLYLVLILNQSVEAFTSVNQINNSFEMKSCSFRISFIFLILALKVLEIYKLTLFLRFQHSIKIIPKYIYHIICTSNALICQKYQRLHNFYLPLWLSMCFSI